MLFPLILAIVLHYLFSLGDSLSLPSPEPFSIASKIQSISRRSSAFGSLQPNRAEIAGMMTKIFTRDEGIYYIAAINEYRDDELLRQFISITARVNMDEIIDGVPIKGKVSTLLHNSFRSSLFRLLTLYHITYYSTGIN